MAKRSNKRIKLARRRQTADVRSPRSQLIRGALADLGGPSHVRRECVAWSRCSVNPVRAHSGLVLATLITIFGSATERRLPRGRPGAYRRAGSSRRMRSRRSWMSCGRRRRHWWTVTNPPPTLATAAAALSGRCGTQRGVDVKSGAPVRLGRSRIEHSKRARRNKAHDLMSRPCPGPCGRCYAQGEDSQQKDGEGDPAKRRTRYSRASPLLQEERPGELTAYHVSLAMPECGARGAGPQAGLIRPSGSSRSVGKPSPLPPLLPILPPSRTSDE